LFSLTPPKNALRLSGKVAPDTPSATVAAPAPSFLRFSLNLTPSKMNKVAPASVLPHQKPGQSPEYSHNQRPAQNLSQSLSSSSARSLQMIDAESKYGDIESAPIGVVTPFVREEYYLSSSSSSSGRSSF